MWQKNYAETHGLSLCHILDVPQEFFIKASSPNNMGLHSSSSSLSSSSLSSLLLLLVLLLVNLNLACLSYIFNSGPSKRILYEKRLGEQMK